MTDIIKIKKQTKNVITITVNDDNGDPVNLTGYTAKMQFRDKINNSLALTLDTETVSGSRLAITNPTLGQLIITLVSASGLTAKEYKTDVALITGGEVEFRVPLDFVLEDVVTEYP